MGDFATDESARRGAQIDIEPDDIVISTYAKSGTTWLQQVVHQLRSGGDMTFEEISVVVPWLGVAHDMGIDPAEQPWRPRAFKLHRAWEDVPMGGRIITAFRSPQGVLRSFYRFFSGAFFEADSIALDEFTHGWFLQGTGSGLYFDHIASFWPHVRDPHVLAFTYEDMQAAPAEVVRVVAGFMDITDEATIDVAIRHSSRPFMAAHADQFDDHPLSASIRERTGVPVGLFAKVHAAPPDVTISGELDDALDAMWAAIVTPATGFSTYEELREAMPDHLGVRSRRPTISETPPPRA
jgi:hypothetical protein